MDPPSAQEEWASLVEETNNDGGLCPINPSGGTGARGGRRPTTKPPSSSASQTSGSGTASRLISTARSRLNNMRSGGGGGFSFRHMLVIFILSGMLGILIIIVSNAETSIETAAVTDVEVVHHESIVSDIAVEPTDIGGGKSIESGEQSIDNESTGGDLAGDSNIAQSTPEESTKSNNSETATSEKTTSSPVQTDANTILGFHDASPESFTHANYYLKPKGVGYPLAPKGGLHPIYIHDAENADQMTSYGDDFSENSPYADDRLKLTPEQRKEEQKQWETHLNEIREKYGSWNFKDTYREKNGKERPVVDFETIGKEKESKKEGYNSLHGEIEKEDFPAGVWQTDNEYVTNFLREARVLIERVQESIYAEYGWGRSSITDDQVAGRKTSFGVYLVPPNEPKGKGFDAAKGIAWMYKDSFDHLVKKLLNAMMTNDHFFAILGGHSAAAGHGNNFHQSYMMQFQEVLEPVFDRLGMVLVSANRAQGGMGTVQASLAGESIFGEKDFMVWDSSMTEKGAGHQEVFMRQMLLTGHRVPILFDMGGGKGTLDGLYEEVGAYVGGLTSGNPPYIEETKSLEQAKNLPFAVQHLFCSSGNDSCTKNEHKYNAHCWTDRVDVEPPKPQSNKYGSQVSWHPGFRTHKWNGRRLSLLILQALDAAITLWEQNASSPLESKHWHLAAEEQTIRDNLKKVDVAKTECGKLMANKVPRLCITPMRGATEWAPRADPDHSSMRSLLKPSPSGYVPQLFESPTQVYKGRDPHFPIMKIPDGEVDVAAVSRSLPPQSNRRRSLTFPRTQQEYISSSAVQQQQNLRSVNKRQNNSRNLEEKSGIVPGEGWTVIGHPAGFCDGTSNAECHREPDTDCLMGGHNDSRGILLGDGLSGWLVFELKNIKEGIFIARTELWHEHNSNPITVSWTSENNGRDDGRHLKKAPPPLPDDYAIEVAVNGVIQYRVDEEGFKAKCDGEISYNVQICVLVDDLQLASTNENQDMEVAIRVAGGGREAVLGISHVYYA